MNKRVLLVIAIGAWLIVGFIILFVHPKVDIVEEFGCPFFVKGYAMNLDLGHGASIDWLYMNVNANEPLATREEVTRALQDCQADSGH